jgi:hypothetical protein
VELIVTSVISLRIPNHTQNTAPARTPTTSGESVSKPPTSSRLISTTSDYNYVREGNRCVPVGPEPIPAGVCVGDAPNQTYQGSSGYRLIPGNTCRKDNGGVIKDDPVTKSCDQGESPHIHNFQTKSSQLNLKRAMLPIKLCVFGVVFGVSLTTL